ncbi:MAG: NAD(P)H-binding protein [Thermoguttaceae bacterium]|nr:NAD(P)H-binding protein [Thermoguttaceae bacterium]
MKVAVTGAFGYSGRWIASLLIERGHQVVTLTNHKPPATDASFESAFLEKREVHPLNFTEPATLTRAMNGCDALVNTYWVRFNHGHFTHEAAVRNTAVLFQSAVQAGVKRIVHTSIANPLKDSPFEYYRGKAEVEELLRESGVPHTILRPTVLFGEDDILINNIAWTLRRFPIVGYFGNGRYRIRPLHVRDFAHLAADSVMDTEPSRVINAVGPEDYAYRDLLRLIAQSLGLRRMLIRVPIGVGYSVAKLIGWWHQDVFLTRPEIGGLMVNLLTCDASVPSVGSIRLSEWLCENAQIIGRNYANELARRCAPEKSRLK